MGLIIFALWQLIWFLTGLALFAFVMSLAFLECFIGDAEFRRFLRKELAIWWAGRKA